MNATDTVTYEFTVESPSIANPDGYALIVDGEEIDLYMLDGAGGGALIDSAGFEGTLDTPGLLREVKRQIKAGKVADLRDALDITIGWA